MGSYTVTITHDDCSDCPETSDAYDVFKFSYSTYIDTNYTTSGRNSQLCSLAEEIFGLNAPKGDYGSTSNEVIVGWVQQGKAVVITTHPYGVYTGNVRKRFKYTLQIYGEMRILNYTKPNDSMFLQLSISYGILSASVPLAGGDEFQYGSSLSDVNGYLKIGENSEVPYGDVSHDYSEVPFPSFPFVYREESFPINILHEINDINRLYTVETPMIALGRVYAGSNAKVDEGDWYRTRVKENSAFIEAIMIEPMVGDEYEIPTN